MMQIMLVFLLLFFQALGAEDFITGFEYGQMLYNDPHGASCASCHGETGGGKLISRYLDNKNRHIDLNGPDIRHSSLEQIKESIEKGRGVMPRYFLTDKEIKTIYEYIQKVNQPKKTSVSKLFSRDERK